MAAIHVEAAWEVVEGEAIDQYCLVGDLRWTLAYLLGSKAFHMTATLGVYRILYYVNLLFSKGDSSVCCGCDVHGLLSL